MSEYILFHVLQRGRHDAETRRKKVKTGLMVRNFYQSHVLHSDVSFLLPFMSLKTGDSCKYLVSMLWVIKYKTTSFRCKCCSHIQTWSTWRHLSGGGKKKIKNQRLPNSGNETLRGSVNGELHNWHFGIGGKDFSWKNLFKLVWDPGASRDLITSCMEPFHSAKLLQLSGRILQHCAAVTLWKCFADYETSSDFPLEWVRGENDCSFCRQVKGRVATAQNQKRKESQVSVGENGPGKYLRGWWANEKQATSWVGTARRLQKKIRQVVTGV